MCYEIWIDAQHYLRAENETNEGKWKWKLLLAAMIARNSRYMLENWLIKIGEAIRTMHRNKILQRASFVSRRIKVLRIAFGRWLWHLHYALPSSLLLRASFCSQLLQPSAHPAQDSYVLQTKKQITNKLFDFPIPLGIEPFAHTEEHLIASVGVCTTDSVAHHAWEARASVLVLQVCDWATGWGE